MNWILRMFSRRRAFDDLSEEIREHLEEKVEELVAGGMPRREAEASARREFGSVRLAEEDGREVWRWDLVESVLADVRFGARGLRKARGFAVVAVLTLGLGIGATTAIFSIIRAVLMNPLAMEEPRRVMVVRETWRETFASVSVGNFADVRRQSGSFANLCALNEASFNLATQDAPVRVSGELATADCFATFGVAPIAGRFFATTEDEPGRERVVLISERLWRTRLGGDLAIVGRALRINGVPHIVVGIMPKTFDPVLSGSELWIPQAFTSGQIADHDNHYLTVIARLKPSVSAEQAQSEMNLIAQRLQQAYPLDDRERGLNVRPLPELLLGDERLALRLMFAAVGFVLLIGCANIANLQLARSRTREKEMALRIALGASRQRLVRQLLLENVALGLTGGVIGVLLAYWGLSWIVAHGPAEMPRLDQAQIDPGALVFACVIALLCSLLFGLAPALRSASTSLVTRSRTSLLSPVEEVRSVGATPRMISWTISSVISCRDTGPPLVVMNE